MEGATLQTNKPNVSKERSVAGNNAHSRKSRTPLRTLLLYLTYVVVCSSVATTLFFSSKYLQSNFLDLQDMVLEKVDSDGLDNNKISSELNDMMQEINSLESSLSNVTTDKSDCDGEIESYGADLKNLKNIMKNASNLMHRLTESKRNEKKKTSFTGKEKKKPMNILLLYADDWRYDTLGLENPIVKTPVLDQLARDGIRFTENCVTTSVCWCSRVTMYSGQYLARHGSVTPKEFYVNWRTCIYSLLQKAGYYVGHIGKWGVDHKYKTTVHFSAEQEGWHYEQLGDKLWHITERNEADALQFLRKRNKSKPFFANVAFFATHAVDGDKRQYFPQNRSMSMYVNDIIPKAKTATLKSWKKLPDFFDEYNEGRIRWTWRYETNEKYQHMMKNYYRMASEVDSACGSILRELKAQGELENTLVIFTTDNGNFHAEHGLADKWYPHQESIRVPLIILDPRMPKEKKGTTNSEFTLNLDLPTTILGAAGVKPPKSMMGRDIADLYLKNDTEWRQDFFYEHPTIFSIDYVPSSEALVRKDYKYFFWPDYGVEQLFDMKADPFEDNDLRNSDRPKHRKILNEMRQRFTQLRKIVHNKKLFVTV